MTFAEFWAYLIQGFQALVYPALGFLLAWQRRTVKRTKVLEVSEKECQRRLGKLERQYRARYDEPVLDE